MDADSKLTIVANSKPADAFSFITHKTHTESRGRKICANQTADGNNNIQPGSPRAVKLSLVAKF